MSLLLFDDYYRLFGPVARYTVAFNGWLCTVFVCVCWKDDAKSQQMNTDHVDMNTYIVHVPFGMQLCHSDTHTHKKRHDDLLLFIIVFWSDDHECKMHTHEIQDQISIDPIAKNEIQKWWRRIKIGREQKLKLQKKSVVRTLFIFVKFFLVVIIIKIVIQIAVAEIVCEKITSAVGQTVKLRIYIIVIQ